MLCYVGRYVMCDYVSVWLCAQLVYMQFTRPSHSPHPLREGLVPRLPTRCWSTWLQCPIYTEPNQPHHHELAIVHISAVLDVQIKLTNIPIVCIMKVCTSISSCGFISCAISLTGCGCRIRLITWYWYLHVIIYIQPLY